MLTQWKNQDSVQFSKDHFTIKRVLENPFTVINLFGFLPGQSLKEHKTSSTAIVQVLKGQITLETGSDTYLMEEGHTVVIDPEATHKLTAHTQSIVQLILTPHPTFHTLQKEFDAQVHPDN